MKKISKYLFSFLYSLSIILFFQIPAATAGASDVPEALPSAGLPSLSDYHSGYSRSFGSLPSKYDSRALGYLTSIKDQNPWGTCWAFGALASGEASLIKKGLADTSINLSELHLSYFFFEESADPLGNTHGDKVSLPPATPHYLDSGGNNLFTMFALSKWIGAVPESSAPYSHDDLSVPTLNQNLAYADISHLQNARFVSTADISSVKKLIMEYGAVSTAMYYDSRYLSRQNAYYCPRVSSFANHIVTLVGWDDAYPKKAFSSKKVSSNGAWIVKNSYGTDFGDNGYFYLSYEDATLLSRGPDALSYAFDMEKADNYDFNYQYDGSYGASTFRIPNGSSLSNIFTVSGASTGNEQLEAISFSLFTTDVNYRIQIYKNPDPGNPTSGTPVFNVPQSGNTTYSGYYTIPLKYRPVFQKGDTFSVVVTFKARHQSGVDCFIDYTSTTAGIRFTSSSSDGLSFYKTNGTWKDLNAMSEGATARIKAFTSRTSAPASNPQQGTAALHTKVAQPKIKKAVPHSSAQVLLSWSSIKKADNYKIYRSTSKKGPYTMIGKTASLKYLDTKCHTGATYYYRIRACQKSGKGFAYSPYSNIVKVRVQPSKPVITKLVPTGKKLKLSWKKVSGASGYSIYRSTEKRGSYQRIKILSSGKKTSYLMSLPPKGNTYYYKVRAYRLVNGKRIAGDYSAARPFRRK